MSGRATPSLGPIRGAGVASVYLRLGSFLSKMSNRMLKKSASGVLASLRGSTYRSVRLASSLAAALLDSLFEHPEVILVSAPNGKFWPYLASTKFFRSLLKVRRVP